MMLFAKASANFSSRGGHVNPSSSSSSSSVAWQPDPSDFRSPNDQTMCCLDVVGQTNVTSQYPDIRDDVMPFGISVAGVTLGSVVLLLGVFGNAVVVLAVWRHRPLRRSSNLFVTSLALCDLFHSLFVRPLYVYSYAAGGWPFGARFCVYALVSSNLAVLESILHVTAIAFHRYVVLVHPRLSRCFQRRLAIVAVLAAIYVLPLSVVLFQSWRRISSRITFGREVIFNGRTMFCSFVRHSEFRLVAALKKIGFVVAAAVFIFYCYVRIYHLVRTRGKRLNVYGSLTPVRLRRELTLLKTVIAVFLTFVVNYLPITLIYGTDTKRTLPYVAYFVGVMLLWTSTGVNWIVYGLMNAQYSKAYRVLFCGAGAAGGTAITATPDGPPSVNAKVSLSHPPPPAAGRENPPSAGPGGGGDSRRSAVRSIKLLDIPEVGSSKEEDHLPLPLSTHPAPPSPPPTPPFSPLRVSMPARETVV